VRRKLEAVMCREFENFKNFVCDLESAVETRKQSRRRIFKFLRQRMGGLRDSSPWMYGKISRGYSSDIKDSQLIAGCKHFINQSF
jgi:hypothetical protein